MQTNGSDTETSRKSRDDGLARLEQVRDLLFGENLRAVDERIAALERKLDAHRDSNAEEERAHAQRAEATAARLTALDQRLQQAERDKSDRRALARLLRDMAKSLEDGAA